MRVVLVWLVVMFCAGRAWADDSRWAFDPVADTVQSVLVADGITSTIRIEIRDWRPWLVWEYRGPKQIAEFEAVNLVFKFHARAFRYAQAGLRQADDASLVEIPIHLQDVYLLGDENPVDYAFGAVQVYAPEEKLYLRFHYRLEGEAEGNTWYQELTSNGATEAVGAWVMAHQADILADRYAMRGPAFTRWDVDTLAKRDGAVRIAAPANAAEFAESEAVSICAHFADGAMDASLAAFDRIAPGLSLRGAVHKLNCTRNKRAYAPGRHVFSHMLDPKYIGVTFRDIVSLIDRFENAGPESGAYLSNLAFCKRLIMKRCGRGCYAYPRAVTIFDEIDDWRAKYPLDYRFLADLREIDRQFHVHQKRFPVIFNPNACPAHLTKRADSD